MNKLKTKTNLPLKQKIIAIIAVLLSTLVFTTNSSLVKEVSHEADTFHIIFWRSIVGFLIVLPIAVIKKEFRKTIKKLDKNLIKWLIIRGVIGSIGMLTTFAAVSFGDLGEVGALQRISPIFTIILAYFLLKEEINYKIIFAVILAITGVFFVRNPFVIGFTASHILVFISAFAIGFVSVCVRKLRSSGLEVWIVISVLLLTTFFISFPKIIIDEKWYTTRTFLFLLAIGVVSTLFQLLITFSHKYLLARTVSIIGLLAVFEMMTAGFLFFGEEISPYKVIGAILIVFSSGYTIYVSVRPKKAKEADKKPTD